jgi:hypothetical protein
MDQMYEKFKPACKTSARRIMALKMKERLDARRRGGLAAVEEESTDGDSDNNDNNNDDNLLLSNKTLTDNPKKRRSQSICNISFSNLDLGHLVNGWPGDPMKLRPFDNNFSSKKIIQSWVDVGFLPMTGIAALHPKVRHELGEGGAPPDAGERMQLLLDDYKRQALELTSLGFNGDLLDLEPPSVVDTSIPEGEEAQIQLLLANGRVTKAGGLFKAGVHLANGRVVNEVHRRQGLLDETARVTKEAKKMSEHDVLAHKARKYHNAWVEGGRNVNPLGHPILRLKEAKCIVKYLLPLIDIVGASKLGDFKTVKVCIAWLGGIGRGMTWDEHMQAATDEFERKELEAWEAMKVENAMQGNGTTLFEIGGV